MKKSTRQANSGYDRRDFLKLSALGGLGLSVGRLALAGAASADTAETSFGLPTVRPIDPVRMLTNRSSGKQGYAIASALAKLGAEVTLVSGPTALSAPPGVNSVDVEAADQMRNDFLAARVAIRWGRTTLLN